MDNKIVKFILHIEKIIGVFRNFCNYPKKLKTFVILTICVEAATHTALGYSELSTKIPLNVHLLRVMHAVFTVVLSASSCYYSKHFMSLLNLLSQIDGKLKCNSNDVISSFSIFIMIQFPLVFCIAYSMNLHWRDVVWYKEAIQAFREVFFFRFMAQSVLLMNMLYVLRNQLEWITRGCTRSDDDDELFYKRGSPSVVELKMEPPAPYALDDYVDAYRNIRAATQQINKIFSLQILMIISCKCAYYISCLYKMAYDIVKSDYAWALMGIVSLRFMLYFLTLLGLCWSAQNVMKSVNTLQHTLGRNMINFVLSDKRSFQETRNFSRGIARNPVKIQVYGFIDVDMTLLPKLMMLIVSYTVLVLQYNNII